MKGVVGMKLFDKFKKLNKRQRTEFIAASALSAVFLISLPTYAWFASSKNLETITKIRQPGNIIIRSGKSIREDEADPIVNFEMKDIDIEAIATSGKPQRFVFSVYPGDSSFTFPYNLQIAHTTNIPFTYKIYKADAPDTTGWTDEQKAELTAYKAINGGNTKYYQIVPYSNSSNEIPMTVLNPDDSSTFGKTALNGDEVVHGQETVTDPIKCYSQTYDEGDTPDVYAVPIYMQTAEPLDPKSLEDSEVDRYDYYILELGWDSSASSINSSWGEASNNEETDIIYITAESSSKN